MWFSFPPITTTTVSSIFLPLIAAPTGDSVEILFWSGFASKVPTTSNVSTLPANGPSRYSIVTFLPTLTTSSFPSWVIIIEFLIMYSSSLIRSSNLPWFSLAASYSAFSLKSPWAFASCYAWTISFLPWFFNVSNSFFNSARPSSVKWYSLFILKPPEA